MSTFLIGEHEDFKKNVMDVNELIDKINDCAIRIRRQLPQGYLENVYKNAMVVELKANNLEYETERAIKVVYEGVVVGEYRADIVVEDMLVLELKAVQNLNTAHEVQLVNYLTATGIDDGLLINFGGEKIEIRHKYRKYNKSFRKF
jgi:GxxExxY protein